MIWKSKKYNFDRSLIGDLELSNFEGVLVDRNSIILYFKTKLDLYLKFHIYCKLFFLKNDNMKAYWKEGVTDLNIVNYTNSEVQSYSFSQRCDCRISLDNGIDILIINGSDSNWEQYSIIRGEAKYISLPMDWYDIYGRSRSQAEMEKFEDPEL